MGTKVAWGPPLAPLKVPARQWFELLTDKDPSAEVERLVYSLGATWGGDGVDGGGRAGRPDGNEFRLRPLRPAA